MGPWRLRAGRILVTALLLSTSLGAADKPQEQATGAKEPAAQEPQPVERLDVQANATTPRTAPKDNGLRGPEPAKEGAVRGEDSEKEPPQQVRPKEAGDHVGREAKDKAGTAKGRTPGEALQESEPAPVASSDITSSSSDSGRSDPRWKQPATAKMEEVDITGGEGVLEYEEEDDDLLDDSVEAAMRGFQQLKEVLSGWDPSGESKGGVWGFVNNALRSLYAVVTYDFCQADDAIPEATDPRDKTPPSTSRQGRGQGDETAVAEVKTAPSCAGTGAGRKGGRLADWRHWRQAGRKPHTAVLSRLACLLRRAGYRLYPVRKPAQFWPPGDTCTVLCDSCECDYDENSTCAKAMLAWKARTPALVYTLYAALHNSRVLCASALLLSVLRKHYVYRTVLCAPLIILLCMVTKCLYIIMQLRRYLENTVTPVAHTRDCSNRHSEDEDAGVSTFDRHRLRDGALNEEHPEKHAEIYTNKLNHTMSSLQTFCSFIETTRTYYKSKITNALRELLDAVFRLQEPKT
ncbi:uncharacterized protein LOC144130391 isoform X3 [Amblyomma americanum]